MKTAGGRIGHRGPDWANATYSRYTTTARPDLGKQLGFVGTKVPLPFGPADGDEGFRKNIAWIKSCRDMVGDERDSGGRAPPLAHLHRDCAHPRHVCTRTGLTAAA